jgi:2-keto-4-pentenoate hydratase/2-oxohepta-3-ene-1,7-dioic acid hydratase in catechol pathway
VAADLARERALVRRGRAFPRSLLELIQAGPETWAFAGEVVRHGEGLAAREGVDALAARTLGHAARRIRLEAPLPRPPRNIFCRGRNYAEHAAEQGAEAPAHPVYFTKPPESVLAPGGEIVYHAVTTELDYEVELAVVIGWRAGTSRARTRSGTCSATRSSTT